MHMPARVWVQGYEARLHGQCAKYRWVPTESNVRNHMHLHHRLDTCMCQSLFVSHLLSYIMQRCNYTLHVCAQPEFLEGVRARGEQLRSALRASLGGHPRVKELRGLGLITGIQLNTARPCSNFVLARDRLCIAVLTSFFLMSPRLSIWWSSWC